MYKGTLVDDTILWNGEFAVELFQAGQITLPLLPAQMTLREVKVDGVPSAIFVEDGRFATRVSGLGKHELEVEFQTPVNRGQGPPTAMLSIPRVPVTRFELSLPGKVELSVQPVTSTSHSVEKDRTLCKVSVPMNRTGYLSLGSGRAPIPSGKNYAPNATLYHTIYAERRCTDRRRNCRLRNSTWRDQRDRVELTRRHPDQYD